MIEPEAQRTDSTHRSATSLLPPILRLVLSFKESSEGATLRPDPSDEAYHVENLFIAAESSYTALSRLADRWHGALYSERPPSDLEELQVLVDGYGDWLDGAQPLFERLKRLEKSGYESNSVGHLESWMWAAKGFLTQDRDRRSLERKALTTDRLAVIAARLKPSQLD